MREISIVMRRELKSYFHSPIAYVVGALFLLVICFLFCMQALLPGNRADMNPFFNALPVFFLILLPALTMRLWAEERKEGTLELLLTFPVRIYQLIVGKFLASMAYLCLILALTLGIPITMTVFGKLDWPPVIASYLACLLMAGAYLSVGMFWSSTTRNQIIALIVAVATLFALYFGLDWLSAFLVGVFPSWLGGDLVVVFVSSISPKHYFASIARGVVDTGDLVYYLCFCAFFLHANALVLYGRKVKG